MKTAIKKRKAAEPLSFINLLGGESIVRHPVGSDFDLISLSNEGISKASVDALVGHLGISRKAFSENILDTSVKTLERKKNTDKLDKRTSSHIIEITKVVEHAFEVFEDENSVKQWLNSPNRALGGIKPIDLFYIPTGLSMVDNILGRIEHGVYS
ncbi:MAG TPA: antitoxin Xre/MbcA/ParS toxin-binding domain-containing protein [Mucilaginibacter sp.]|jgi:putative toxin-antitoxin system antitoxin component (TIGR02293 family)|nr:antitoxin Xre/MbcA/ParS toxin-binding domain-containing protein [Mucilaginibacter sp.]